MSKVLSLIKHELVVATGLQARHGISGHSFELIEYWWYFRQHGVDAVILCTAHKPAVLLELAKRYSFTEAELSELRDSIVDGTDTMVAQLPATLWVDGCFKYHPVATVVSKCNIAFLCNNSETLDQMDIVLGDTRIYDHPCGHYVKKLLFDKFRPVKTVVKDTAMLYCTIQARKVSDKYLTELPKRFDFSNFLIITNQEFSLPPNYKVAEPPVPDLFSQFNAYIYSPLKIDWAGAIDVLDCSPRFPAECKFYGKEILVDAPVNRGLGVRLHDLECLDSISLTKNDPLINIISPCIS